jgi:hypothetical protein
MEAHMRAFMIACFFAVLAAADVAELGSGVATVPGTQIADATDQALTDAYKEALKNAGADAKTIDAMDKQGAIKKAVEQLRKAKPPARADTFAFFSGTKDGVKKWSITLLPGTFADDEQKKITETHEEGHRKVDGAAVDALNEAAKAGKIPKGADGSKLSTLLVIYENAGNKKFHEVYGNSPKKTKEKLNGDDPAKLQEKALKEAKEAGEKALEQELKKDEKPKDDKAKDGEHK